MRFVIAALCCALAGCAAVNLDKKPPPMPPTSPPNTPLAPATAGAIYHAGNDLALFQDVRARNVGDLITIQLVESTNATSSASTKTSKKSDVDMSVGTLFGGKNNKLNKLLNSTGSSGNSFDGSGDTSQSNKLDGFVTVTVAERLINGNLLVRGEKWIQLNRSNEYVQISGIVRPADIAPDNSVPSSRVADARIAYGGRGEMAQSNAMGWLSRFFNSPYAPM